MHGRLRKPEHPRSKREIPDLLTAISAASWGRVA